MHVTKINYNPTLGSLCGSYTFKLFGFGHHHLYHSKMGGNGLSTNTSSEEELWKHHFQHKVFDKTEKLNVAHISTKMGEN